MYLVLYPSLLFILNSNLSTILQVATGFKAHAALRVLTLRMKALGLIELQRLNLFFILDESLRSLLNSSSLGNFFNDFAGQPHQRDVQLVLFVD